MKTIDLLVQELPALGGFPEGAVEAGFLCSDDTLYFVNKDGDCPSEWRISMNYEVEDRWVKVTHDQYESALAFQNEGWIEWRGGRCPVDVVTEVDIKFRTGAIVSGVKAGGYYWPQTGREYDIIAYRLHKPQQAEQAKDDDEANLNECIGQDAAQVWSGEGQPPVGVECEVSVDGGRSWCTYRAINEKNGARLIEIGNFTEEFQNNNWIFRPIRSEAVRKREEAVKAITLTGWCQTAAEEIYDLIAAGKVPGMKLED